ncbi:heme ABC transporter ATP-binding protein [Aeromicrobium wangtongii]|uniref:Heme ABC transporter ATP-binding protein n=1 Tax=Aeromicrobium wangtongii TaxID=2969247 RepID=A0ABY5M4B1_9ACTN|nr:heme ABC transporter ATP-binding protein [Aeromicrobium wangtongii]MCD9198953.1 heme ABC transporter ATP-binding protein [Aeromicrobium wangtongii]UUP13009.1 heme ABC transporter ATP-binding protein [Aeromicrobium wangtongii]
MTLQLTDVSAELGGHPVLHDVTLEVRPGELVALVGPNGAGKTTLLSVMAGDITPTSGTACLDGTELRRWKIADLARERAVLPQEQRLAFGFRVVDVVRMGRAPWARRPEEDLDDVIVAESMRQTDVDAMADRAFPTLSGGEKARTSFARVLAQQTSLVLLDEPTAALDIRHSEQVLSRARRLAADGHAVVAVLHDLTVAAAHADRICVLADGRLRADGPPAQVLTPELVAEVYGHPVDVITHQGRTIVLPHLVPIDQEASCAPVH